jgi:hypothetical protein
VNNTKGQVWNLSQVNGKLLMGHHDGGFVIENGSATAIDNSSGFWTFQPYSNVLPSSIMITGTYNGINFYNHRDGKFINRDIHAHFESATTTVTGSSSTGISTRILSRRGLW